VKLREFGGDAPNVSLRSLGMISFGIIPNITISKMSMTLRIISPLKRTSLSVFCLNVFPRLKKRLMLGGNNTTKRTVNSDGLAPMTSSSNRLHGEKVDRSVSKLSICANFVDWKFLAMPSYVTDAAKLNIHLLH
jgi:hypothetical protein